MKKQVKILFFLPFILVSCSGNLTPTPVQLALPTSSITPPSPTLAPSATPTFTATITPTPTITPTFDPYHIQTITPAPPELCVPIENPETPPPITFDNQDNSLQDAESNTIILNYINQYGINNLINADMVYIDPGGTTRVSPNKFPVADLTTDGIPELIETEYSHAFILGCRGGQYQILAEFKFPIGIFWHIEAITDANRNGVSEIAFNNGYLSQGGHSYSVWEWNGTSFETIFESSTHEDPAVYATGTMEFEDSNGDGIQEIIINTGIYIWGDAGINFGPWRNITKTYRWNGNQYTFLQEEWDPPDFRFQAVQDGDRLFLQGEYEQALGFYQQAIASDKLRWISAEYRKYVMDSYLGNATSMPAEDKNEYIALSAYAYFRVMLIHLAEGRTAHARDIYQVIQSQYGDTAYGNAFAEMATSFWNEYNVTNNIPAACQSAISYAEGHQEEILRYLGNSRTAATYYGKQSLDYTPESVCPVK